MGSIFPSTVVFNFWRGQVREYSSILLERGLFFLISKIAKFANDLLKTNEDIGPQSPKILQTFVLWGAQTCHQPYKRL